MGSAYDFESKIDFTREADGVTIHIPFPGERHIFVPWKEWDELTEATESPSKRDAMYERWEAEELSSSASGPNLFGATLHIPHVGSVISVPKTKPEESKRAKTPRPTAAHKTAGAKRK